MTTPSHPWPLLVAGTDTVLLQLDHPEADACRQALAAFAELERSPGHVHTYRLTDLGLWNAKAAGLDLDTALATIERFSGGPVPHATASRIAEAMNRFGAVTLESVGGELLLCTESPELLAELRADDEVAALLGPDLDDRSASVNATDRGRLKLALTRLRRPADDRAALTRGRSLGLLLRPEARLRPYQRDAVGAWTPSGTGVIVLPCGAGKTITALAAAAEVGADTLILTTGQASMTQWERELLRFTDVEAETIGHYGAGRKEIRPITLTTYQMLATRRNGRYRHLDLLDDGRWGLVIYDEVHLLPSAVFSLTAGVQARRRLGLTATLVREDGREADVFTLVGPKRYDVPWSELELQGWIAPARCTEIRVVPSDDERMAHARATGQARAQVAARTRAKFDVVGRLLERHRDEPTLIIGSYVEGLAELAQRHDLPLVTGRTANGQRLELFDALREGRLSTLVVSKVANFSLDLPEVSVAIQVSGTFGSRQEEAQRLGRLLRPKSDGRQAHFYSLVARDTVEQEHSARRQRFLAEQGYHYEIRDAADLD